MIVSRSCGNPATMCAVIVSFSARRVSSGTASRCESNSERRALRHSVTVEFLASDVVIVDACFGQYLADARDQGRWTRNVADRRLHVREGLAHEPDIDGARSPGPR